MKKKINNEFMLFFLYKQRKTYKNKE